MVTDTHGNPNASTSPSGLSPAQIKAAYGFSTSNTAGAGMTVAIVDAYDDPTAESDLNVFSSQFGLPACTTANGCFKKVNQTGGTSYPQANAGWALEISLDIQWAHAIAPGAKILLVEANSNSFANLLAAEDYARAHAQYVSNSWGASEFSGETSYDSHFSQSGVSFFVSSGDAGLPAEYPSASPNVISVGGTTLHFSGSTFTRETGWSSGGGGCSSYETATSAQSGFGEYGQVNCGGKRATPDVSLDADPASGVSVYDSTRYYGQTGWFTVGGTSASAPMWAGRSAVAGAVVNSAYVYGSSITYRDITSGNNGAPCLVGYDLCTGRGSWLDSAGGGGGGGTDNPPSVAITSPTGGTVYGTVTVSANASDDNGVTSVQFFVDGTSIGTDTTAGNGWSALWDTTAATNGAHSLSATATDTIGQQTTSSPVSVTVDNTSSTGTTVSLSGSSTNNGSTWTASVTVTTDPGVDVAWHWSNGASGSGSCTTNGSGTCTVSMSGIPKRTGAVTFTVDTVGGSTTFDGTGSIDVLKP